MPRFVLGSALTVAALAAAARAIQNDRCVARSLETCVAFIMCGRYRRRRELSAPLGLRHTAAKSRTSRAPETQGELPILTHRCKRFESITAEQKTVESARLSPKPVGATVTRHRQRTSATRPVGRFELYVNLSLTHQPAHHQGRLLRSSVAPACLPATVVVQPIAAASQAGHQSAGRTLPGLHGWLCSGCSCGSRPR